MPNIDVDVKLDFQSLFFPVFSNILMNNILNMILDFAMNNLIIETSQFTSFKHCRKPFIKHCHIFTSNNRYSR